MARYGMICHAAVKPRLSSPRSDDAIRGNDHHGSQHADEEYRVRVRANLEQTPKNRKRHDAASKLVWNREEANHCEYQRRAFGRSDIHARTPNEDEHSDPYRQQNSGKQRCRRSCQITFNIFHRLLPNRTRTQQSGTRTRSQPCIHQLAWSQCPNMQSRQSDMIERGLCVRR